ncbi:MAG: M24 family metallopeptidase [Candidatus Margulisiibacteriota bacterium]
MPSNRISKIKTAARIADEVMLSIPDILRPGMTELRVASQIKKHIRKKGGHRESFRIIVASGKRSALPHGYATKKIIRKNEIVMIDIGVHYKGYCSDITRMFFVGIRGCEPLSGSNAPIRIKKIYNIIKSAQLKAIRMVKAGIPVAKIDKTVRKEFKRYRMEKYFTHGTGHGIGKKVHEEPRISHKTHPKLKSNQIITIEPGLYFKNKFGIRIEDMVLVKKNGYEIMTKAPK